MSEGTFDVGEDPDVLLDPHVDPGSVAFNALGSESSSELNWFRLLNHRVQTRVETSGRLRWWVLWSLLAGLLALNFTFTVFIVALPDVAGQLHTSVTVLTWTMIGPLLAYGLAAPILGKVGDVYGHRRLYLIGLASALLSALLTAIAPNVFILIAARTFDGLQGAATGTASGALINMVFAREERVKAMGWWSLVGAGGPVIGVSLGAPIIATFGWRALFWFQLVLIAVALCVVAVVLPSRTEIRQLSQTSRREQFRSIDWLGSWSLSLCVTFVMLSLSVAPTWGWLGVGSLACDLSALVTGALFVYRLTHTTNPLIPPHYFRRRNFVWPMVLRACFNFAYFGGFFLFPLVMEEGYHYSVGQVGALAIARPLTFALSSPIAGYVAMRVGERVSTIAGGLCLVASMALFAAMSPSTSVAAVALALGLSGMAMGVAMPASSSVMANEVLPNEFGVMSAAQLLAMQVGEVAGIEVLETVQQGIVRSHGLLRASPGSALLETFRIPFLIALGVSAIGFVASTRIRSLERDSRGAPHALR